MYIHAGCSSVNSYNYHHFLWGWRPTWDMLYLDSKLGPVPSLHDPNDVCTTCTLAVQDSGNMLDRKVTTRVATSQVASAQPVSEVLIVYPTSSCTC